MQRYERRINKMDKALEKRINIASSWASSRVGLLDSIERYEDSYAITQEFKEWIICIENKSSKSLHSSILRVPQKRFSLEEETSDKDELLELKILQPNCSKKIYRDSSLKQLK